MNFRRYGWVAAVPAMMLMTACNHHSSANVSSATFSRADVDNSSSLDYAEYVTLIGQQAAAGNKSAQRIQSLSPDARNVELKKQFNALDSNKDGRLSRTELGSL